MAQGLFLGGSGRRTGVHTRPAFPKMPTALSASPLLGAPQAQGDEPNRHEGCKSLVGRSPEAEGNLQLPRHTRPDPRRSQHGRPKCYPITGEAQCYYSRRSCCDWDCEHCQPKSSFWKQMRHLVLVGGAIAFILYSGDPQLAAYSLHVI